MTVKVLLDHRPKFRAIRDQGQRPTCLAHATTAAHEYERNSGFELSPEYLHFHSTAGHSAKGATLASNEQALEKHGQSAETGCPYFTSAPPTTWTPNKGLLVYKRKVERLSHSPDEIEKRISTGGSPILALALPDSFYKPKAPWVISSGGKIRGYHAVVAIGLGDVAGSRTFLIRNSWGKAWGDNGHAWIDDSFLGQHLVGAFSLGQEV